MQRRSQPMENLYDACLAGNVEGLDAVAETLGPEAFTAPITFTTPFALLCAQNGALVALEAIVKHPKLGPSVLAVEVMNGGIAHYAAMRNHVDVLEFIDRVLGVEFLRRPAQFANKTIAHVAADEGCAEVISFIMTHPALGAPFLREPAFDHGTTAAHIAAKGGKLDVLKRIENALGTKWLRMSVDKDGCNIAHFAAMRSDVDTVRYIATHPELCAAFVVKGGNGGTPVHYAAQYGNEPALAFLIDHFGADKISRMKAQGGQTVAHFAAIGGHASVLQLIHGHAAMRALFGGADDQGYLPVHWAAAHGKADALRAILELCGPATLRKTVGEPKRTIAHLASAAGHIVVLDVLAENASWGVPLLKQRDDTGCTIGQQAALNGHIPVIAWIADRIGPEFLRTTDKEGRTAAHGAAALGHDAVVAFLLSTNGVGPELLRRPDKDGHTVAYVAAVKGHLKVLKLLLPALGPEFMLQGAKDGSTPEVRGSVHPAVSKFYKTEVKPALVAAAPKAAGAAALPEGLTEEDLAPAKKSSKKKGGRK
uniref:Ankyrin repeat protein n=1 Tax=Neobodo designis TaxID=312471 RepID=A0A7S1Q8M7_NEODS|mmetsp:Transcript_36663/g.112972  ORF Transcript_36663/g.112972 Transcript_36663/m.112972 type:complete len:538 (+) Transcript_36663:68-1681(+)|eukprot:CAMPEP_0174855562 /NCGR_PEP_ID=MMETSP1114-20130205/33548_1 /TAXON_ID=312471 /ORGANISM="Neobodo designis, Strain CCAP 1951/1" /LENGTH=537 /DNA_ID=CAMNT_0016090303 /DNA_START=66 /DNA_END=1679 /DNA_ORIENTATION=+